MLLQALYKYAQDHGLSRPDGCIEDYAHAYIKLTDNGEYIGLEIDTTPIICPSIGSLAQAQTRSRVLMDKRRVVLGDPAENAKTAYFLTTLEYAGAYNPDILVFLDALKDANVRAAIERDCDANKIKADNRLSCKVDGRCIVSAPETLEWWKQFYPTLRNEKPDDLQPCFVTGEMSSHAPVVRKLKGLPQGHTAGDAFVCFDKPSFQSYNFTKNENCPISKSAEAAVTLALETLIAKGKKIAGATYMHWFDAPVAEEFDPIYALLNGFSSKETKEENADDEDKGASAEIEARANAQAASLLNSIFSGEYVAPLNNTYHTLVISGMQGRMMIRDYQVGSYDELYNSIRQWYDDTSITDAGGKAYARHYSLHGMLKVLLAPAKEFKFEDVEKQLSGITPMVMNAIMRGMALPDSVAARALAVARSQIVASDAQHPMPDTRAVQWLKAYLVRKERNKYNEEVTMPFINPNHPEPAYHCGRMFATYAKIQEFAILFDKSQSKHSPTIIPSFYGSCSQRPAYALGQLQRLSVYHLEKLKDKSKWWAKTLDEMLCGIAVIIGDNIPQYLTVEEQAYFVLGYRHQAADILCMLNEGRAKSKAKKTAEEND